MTSLYDQLVAIIGTPTTDIEGYFLYIVCCFIVITSIKLLYTMIFKFVLNIKL